MRTVGWYSSLPTFYKYTYFNPRIVCDETLDKRRAKRPFICKRISAVVIVSQQRFFFYKERLRNARAVGQHRTMIRPSKEQQHNSSSRKEEEQLRKQKKHPICLLMRYSIEDAENEAKKHQAPPNSLHQSTYDLVPLKKQDSLAGHLDKASVIGLTRTGSAKGE